MPGIVWGTYAAAASKYPTYAQLAAAAPTSADARLVPAGTMAPAAGAAATMSGA